MKITTGQLRQIIREELKKKRSLNEAKGIKLPNKFGITYLGGKEFCIELNEYNFEPSVSEAKKVSDDLIKTLNGLKDKLGIKSMEKEASMYVRDEDVAIGVSFKSDIHNQDMDELIDGGIDYRN